MNVLSLFNGFSGGKLALEKLGVEVGTYYSSEIDKYANKATQAMFDAKPLTFTQWGMAFHKNEFDGASLTGLDALQDKYMMGCGDAGDNDYCITYEYDEYLHRELHKKTRLYQLGSVTDWRDWNIDWASIDLVTGGFPCQAWSMAGKQLGDKDERGMLFWTMLDIMKHVKYHNPKADFLIENVKMKKEFEGYITTHTENALGHVHKILINSALVSAQNRNRYYWTSFEVGQPEDKGLLLKDVVEHDGEYTFMSERLINRQKGRKCLRDDLNGKAGNLSAMEYVKNGRQGDYIKCGSMIGRKINPETGKRDDYNPDLKTVQRIEVRADEKSGTLTTVQKDNVVVTTMRVDTATDIKGHDYNRRIYSGEGKAPTLAASSGGNLEPKLSINKVDNECLKNVNYRKLTPRECFRLQTVPEHHIDTLLSAGISNTQLYKMCGNGWTIDVIAHILKGIV